MKNKRALIFDMDGVIIDSEPIYMNRFYDFFTQNQQEVDIHDIYRVIGTSSDRTWEMLAEMWSTPITPTQFLEKFESYEPHFDFNYPDILFPHIRFLLSELKKMNVAIGLASASPKDNILQVLSDTNIKEFFYETLSGDEVHESKPNPAVYLETMKRLGVKPEDTIVIEDSPSGIKAAKSAKATVIAIKDHRFGLNQEGADYYAKDLMEAYHLITKIWK